MRCMCVSASSHRHTLRIMCAKWDISARSCVFVCLSSAQSLHTLFIFSISLILGPLHIFRSSSFALLESVFVSSFFFSSQFLIPCRHCRASKLKNACCRSRDKNIQSVVVCLECVHAGTTRLGMSPAGLQCKVFLGACRLPPQLSPRLDIYVVRIDCGAVAAAGWVLCGRRKKIYRNALSLFVICYFCLLFFFSLWFFYNFFFILMRFLRQWHAFQLALNASFECTSNCFYFTALSSQTDACSAWCREKWTRIVSIMNNL